MSGKNLEQRQERDKDMLNWDHSHALALNNMAGRQIQVGRCSGVAYRNMQWFKDSRLFHDCLSKWRGTGVVLNNELLLCNSHPTRCNIHLFIFIDALHVSGGSSAHHQEHITVHTASGIVNQYCC